MSFSLTLGLLALFLLLLSAFFFYFAHNVEGDAWKIFLIVIGLFYVLMSMLNVVLALGLSTNQELIAPCENILNNTVEDVLSSPPNGSTQETVTYYYYVDSCADREAPQVIENVFVGSLWWWFIHLLPLPFSVLYLLFRGMKKW